MIIDWHCYSEKVPVHAILLCTSMQGGRVARVNVCFKYQNGMCPRSSESCVYDHKCERCGGRHPSQVCNVNRGRMTPSATVSSGHLNAPRFGQPARQGASVMQNLLSHVQSFRSPSSSRFKSARTPIQIDRLAACLGDYDWDEAQI